MEKKKEKENGKWKIIILFSFLFFRTPDGSVIASPVAALLFFSLLYNVNYVWGGERTRRTGCAPASLAFRTT
jgi:hypothetical protein